MAASVLNYEKNYKSKATKFENQTTKSEFEDDDSMVLREGKIKFSQSHQAKYKIDQCPHVNRPYYAKGRCKQCYSHHGRPNLASACVHKTRVSFAKKMCLPCYQQYFFVQKKSIKMTTELREAKQKSKMKLNH